MAQKTTQYVCSECGYAAPRWLGKCPSCGAFNTMQEEIVAPAPAASSRPSKNAASRSAFALSGGKARPLSEVKYEEFQRVSSGISELDSVLGGGIVRGSLVLLGGDPGIGKSTLLTQTAAHLSKQHKVLYVSAEESCSQVKCVANGWVYLPIPCFF